MAINVQNAFVGRPPMDKGMVYRKDYDATSTVALPTDPLEEVPTGFDDLGAVGEDGLTIVPTRDSTDVRMAGGDVFVSLQQNFDETVTVTLLEDDCLAVVEAVFGTANVEQDDPVVGSSTKTTIFHTSETLPLSTFLLYAVSGDKSKLFVLEKAQVVSVGEIKVLHSDVTRAVLTIKTYKGNEGTGDETVGSKRQSNVIEYRNDGVEAVAHHRGSERSDAPVAFPEG